MRLLQHFDLPVVHLAVVYLFFGESEQYSGGVHVVVHRLPADVGSDDAVVNGRVSVPVLEQMAFDSPQLRVSEQVPTGQAGAVEQHWFLQLEDALRGEGALHELYALLG